MKIHLVSDDRRQLGILQTACELAFLFWNKVSFAASLDRSLLSQLRK